jgi:polysaccharide export outer membrane protein
VVSDGLFKEFLAGKEMSRSNAAKKSDPGGGMVKATWAVACSIFVVLYVAMPLSDSAFAQASTEGSVSDNSIRIRRTAPSPKDLASDDGYRLGPEDQLRISVWDNKELTVDLVVRPDGKISIPLIQDVVAEGLTAPQLAANIQGALSAFIVNPEVSVVVLQVNAPKFYMIGSVARPGTYPLRSDTSVLQALALAGGLTQFASPRSIKLIRAIRGKQEIRKINYYDVIDSGKGNYILKAGDTIVVP